MTGTAAPRRRLLPVLPRAAWLILGGDALSAVGSGLTLPFLIVYLHAVRGIPLPAVGLAVSGVALASLVGNPLGGSLADRLGARDTLIAGLMVAAAGSASLILVHGATSAFAAAVVVGLGASVIWPAQDALLARVVQPPARSAAFSVRHATMNAGLGAGALLAAVLVNVDRPTTFLFTYLLDAASFVAFVPILLTLPRTNLRRETTGGTVGGYRQVLRDPVFRRVWALTALVVTAGYGQYHAGFPAYATRPGGITTGALGYAFAANTFTVVGAQLLVLRRLGGHRRTTGVMLAVAGWAGAWILTLTAGQLGAGLPAGIGFAAAMVVFALAETMIAPTLPAIVNDLAPEPLRGRYNGCSTLAWTTGFLTGPAIGGLALGAGAGTALFLGLIAACGLAALGAHRLRRHLPAAANLIAFPDAEIPSGRMTGRESLSSLEDARS